jgi:hypothetical protein
MGRLLFLVLVIPLLSSPEALAQSRSFERTVKLSPGGSLTFNATKGSVRLLAWDRDEVEIKARIEAGEYLARDRDYAQRAVDATKVEVTGEGDSVRVWSNYDDVPERDGWFGNNRTIPEIHYDIRAPKHVSLTLDIDRSNSEISGFDGRVRIEADRSELRVKDINGDLRVEIDRGGHSTFQNIAGSFSLEGDRTDVEVEVAKLTDRGHIELDRGDARIRVDEGQPLTLRTDIERRGSFDSDLPVQLQGGTADSPDGTINGGGPTLTVVAHRAHVRLRKL